MDEHKKIESWPDALRVLLLGNGLVNNLAEPEIQIGSLLKKVGMLQEAFADTELSPEKKKLICNELQRQYKYLNHFHDELSLLLTYLQNIGCEK